ncbi:head GIN domain-containing protein [Chloroflexota bacterium]
MRKVIIPTILVAVLAAALLPGCEVARVGNVVTEEKDFTDFTNVDVEGAFEVKIVQADSFKTTISADDSFFDYIAISKVGDTLKIYLNPRHTFTDFTLGAKTLKAEITMPALHGLRLSGATRGTITGFKSSEDFSLDISGASSLDMIDIEVGDAEFEISGASKATGDMKANNAEFEVSGASKVELEGSANNMILNASGANDINLADFPLDNAEIDLNGASEATVNAKGRVDCVVSDASSLYFLGNPTMGNIEVTGASTIKHE